MGWSSVTRPRLHRHRKAAVLVAGLVAASSLSYATASAEPGGEPPQPDATAPAGDASTDVAAWATSHWEEDGYGKVVVDEDNATVRIFWKGEPPADVAERDGEIVDGVTVELVSSTYSDEDLSVVGREVLNDNGDTVIYTHPNEDLSGLVVAVDETATASARAKVAAPNIAAQTDVPVKVIEDEPWEDATRWNDSAPWQGGSILNFSGNGCSSAFTAVKPNGTGRLISAAHCGSKGGVVRDGAGQRIGVVSNRARAYDALLVDPDAGTIGKVFGGPWNAGPGHSRYQHWVGGAAAPAQGQRVCTSGAVSGEHCKLRIRRTGVWKKCAGGANCQGFISKNTVGRVAMAVGDSGGPVYIKRSDGRVGARGVISKGSKWVTCGSTATSTTCYNKVFSIGIHKIERRFGISIEQ